MSESALGTVIRSIRATGLVLLGLVLGLLAAELCLQLAAAVRAATGRRELALSTASGRSILCVGDSNTYGIYLDVADSYPAQLQRLVGESVHVVNLGFPGVNSSRLRADLGQMLDAARPETVLILVGVNDAWTAPAPPPDQPWTTRVARWSRTYLLLSMLWRSVAGEPAIDVPRLPKDKDAIRVDGEEVTARIGDRPLQLGWTLQRQPQWKPRFSENLAAIVTLTRERGVQPIVLTYPSDAPLYRGMSALILQVAQPLGVPVIDLHERFKSLCPAEDCQGLFFGDGHPTGAGYAEVAKIIAAWFEQHRAARGGVNEGP